MVGWLMPEYGRSWKKAVLAWFLGFLWYVLGETEKNNGYLNKDRKFHAEI
jgi:hypothetical protein